MREYPGLENEMRASFCAISIVIGTAWLIAPAGAQSLTLDQMTMAEMIDAAMFTADRCHGMHLVADSVRANAEAAGVTPEQVSSPEWQAALARGEIIAKQSYSKDPANFCERMWHFLGPDHPGIVKFTLLTRE